MVLLGRREWTQYDFYFLQCDVLIKKVNVTVNKAVRHVSEWVYVCDCVYAWLNGTWVIDYVSGSVWGNYWVCFGLTVRVLEVKVSDWLCLWVTLLNWLITCVCGTLGNILQVVFFRKHAFWRVERKCASLETFEVRSTRSVLFYFLWWQLSE